MALLISGTVTQDHVTGKPQKCDAGRGARHERQGWVSMYMKFLEETNLWKADPELSGLGRIENWQEMSLRELLGFNGGIF